MSENGHQDTVQQLTQRVERIEQILPTLATRDDLAAAVSTLATKADLSRTRDELQAKISDMGAGLRAEIAGTRDELRAETAETRRHSTLLYEDLREDNRIVIEHLLALTARVDALARR